MNGSSLDNEHRPLIVSTDNSLTLYDLSGEVRPPSTSPTTDRVDGKISLSSKGVYIHLVKSCIGLGILSLPYAFSHSGLTGGFIMLFVLTLFTAHCMHILARSTGCLVKRFKRASPGYGEVAEMAVEGLQGKWARYKFHARVIVTGSLFSAMLGDCAGIQLFVGQNIQQVIKAAFEVDVNYRLILLVLLPLFVLSSFIRELKTLVEFSVAAVILQIVAFLLMAWYLVNHLHWDQVKQLPSSAEDVFVVYGLFIYPFVTGLVIPLKNRTQQSVKFNTVVTFSMFTISCTFFAVGGLGYVTFPNNPRGSLTLNLPATGQAKDIPNLIVKLYYSASLLLHSLLQLFPVTRDIDDYLLAKSSHYRETRWSSEVMRSLFVVGTFAVAIAIPSLPVLLSFVSAIGGAGVAFIFPALIEMATFWNDPLPKWVMVKDGGIVLLGVLAMSSGLTEGFRSF